MKLTFEQRKILSESTANIGVAWFAGGVVTSVFTAKTFSEIIFPSVWGFTASAAFIALAIINIKK